VEVLVAALISVWVVVIAIVLYVISQASWQEAAAALEIQRKAQLAMETLLRGYKTAADAAARGLLEAKAFTIAGTGDIRFTSGLDSRQRRFYLNNGWLVYDPDVSNPDTAEEKNIVNNISNLVFADLSGASKKIVAIDLSVSKVVKGTNRTIDLSEWVVLRNG
jgi:type II secretory pathway component PulJ